MSGEIPTLILAAGASTRMKGAIKQLLPWGDTNLLEHAIAQARPISEEVYVVLGANADTIIESISKEVKTILNPNWKSGMGTTIATGVRAIMDTKSSPRGVLLMLADQPLMDTAYLQGLKNAFAQGDHKVAATHYGNSWGVPALFHSSLFPELAGLNEEFGARAIIKKYKYAGISILPMGKERDIDTVENYNQLSELHNINNEKL
ncbi:nucleotidyltransferase family protein [Flagellimonas myxillae]|uniref:nucleotidyltransferase family protein n=1 Tax=Flagellimonas myxillae TaxID=2942214 RepID=UPI00201F7259|nr:nucleotidyltransferase family protein [Muricauda myxillae]MCL6265940.1 nucleotidyltransferase family protein [Muricauda myxillae]